VPKATRRQGMRVAVQLPVHVSLVNPAELKAARIDVLRSSVAPGGPLHYWIRKKSSEGTLKDVNPVLVEILARMAQMLGQAMSSWRAQTAGAAGSLCDLSTYGARVRLDHGYSVGDHLRMSFELPCQPPAEVELLTKAVRCRELPEAEVLPFEAAIEFDTVQPEDRIRLVKFVLEKERSLTPGERISAPTSTPSVPTAMA